MPHCLPQLGNRLTFIAPHPWQGIQAEVVEIRRESYGARAQVVLSLRCDDSDHRELVFQRHVYGYVPVEDWTLLIHDEDEWHPWPADITW